MLFHKGNQAQHIFHFVESHYLFYMYMFDTGFCRNNIDDISRSKTLSDVESYTAIGAISVIGDKYHI